MHLSNEQIEKLSDLVSLIREPTKGQLEKKLEAKFGYRLATLAAQKVVDKGKFDFESPVIKLGSMSYKIIVIEMSPKFYFTGIVTTKKNVLLFNLGGKALQPAKNLVGKEHRIVITKVVHYWNKINDGIV